MWNWTVFAFGCLGAAAPEVVRLYKIRSRKLVIRRPIQYFAITVLFLFLGGAVAIALEAESAHSALYVGLSLPTIVSAGLGKPVGNSRSGECHEAAETFRGSGDWHGDGYVGNLRDYLWVLFR